MFRPSQVASFPLFLMFLVTACGTDPIVPPPSSFLPDSISVHIASIRTIVDDPNLLSFEVMSPMFALPAPAPMPGGPTGVIQSGSIPPGNLGSTFVYEPGSGYVLDPSATGAPSDGVRFLLYSVDSTSRTVITPPQEDGYVDLINLFQSSNVTTMRVIVTPGTGESFQYTPEWSNSDPSSDIFAWGVRGNISYSFQILRIGPTVRYFYNTFDNQAAFSFTSTLIQDSLVGSELARFEISFGFEGNSVLLKGRTQNDITFIDVYVGGVRRAAIVSYDGSEDVVTTTADPIVPEDRDVLLRIFHLVLDNPQRVEWFMNPFRFLLF